MNPAELLKAYSAGVGFKKNDVLRPRAGASPITYGVSENTVVVLSQHLLAPHRYNVVGERSEYDRPSDRFVRFEVDGYDWEKIGEA